MWMPLSSSPFDKEPFNGLMDEVRIYNRALTAAEVTALYQQGTTPTITSITPTETVIGKPTTFEVRGQNLNPNMGFTVGDCAYSNVALAGGTPELQKFVCTQFGAAGTKRGLLKTKAGGTILHKFDISAVLVPSTTPMTNVTGNIKIGSKLGRNVILSGDDTFDACLTNTQGQFNCQVPQNWTGVLRPYAKNVSFSPAIIKVENGVVISSTTLQGTTTDVFPSNGVMTKDWVWSLADPIAWHVDMSNGEIDDLNAAYEGRFSFRSAPIAANQTAAIQTTINMPLAGDVRFARRVSSNAGHGVLTFSIDGITAGTWSGEKKWEKLLFPVKAGQHTLRWVYKKDSEMAKGEDAAWIDDVSYNSTVQTRTTACVGITQGTLNLFSPTLRNPTCEQARAYYKWLKIYRPANLKNADSFINAVKGIEKANDTVQSYLDFGGKVFGYFKSIKETTSSTELFTQLHLQTYSLGLGLGVCSVSISDPVYQAACNEANDAVFSLIDYGIATAAGTVASEPEVAGKLISAGLNFGSAIALNTVTKQINSVNLVDSFLDEYYKGGGNLKAMCTKYQPNRVGCSLDYSLIDAFANAKGYYNAWYGTEYLNFTVRIYIDNTIANIKGLK
jgi:hypothetical protein